MSHQVAKRTFWFHGNAVAFGGRIVSPVAESLDALGASVLPPTGGFASASVDSFKYRNIVSFERATSSVAGRVTEHDDGSRTYDTHVTVAVEGLNVLDMVTADRVVARLTSKHDADGYESTMYPIGSYFENLRIGGMRFSPAPYPELAENGSYTKLTEECAKSSKERAWPLIDAQGTEVSIGEQLAAKTKKGEPGAASPIFQDRLLLAPLFNLSEARASLPPGAELIGKTSNGIRVREFGTIFIGEYFVKRYSRRLTMLRIELGCPVKGTIAVGYGDGNGHIYP